MKKFFAALFTIALICSSTKTSCGLSSYLFNKKTEPHLQKAIGCFANIGHQGAATRIASNIVGLSAGFIVFVINSFFANNVSPQKSLANYARGGIYGVCGQFCYDAGLSLYRPETRSPFLTTIKCRAEENFGTMKDYALAGVYFSQAKLQQLYQYAAAKIKRG